MQHNVVAPAAAEACVSSSGTVRLYPHHAANNPVFRVVSLLTGAAQSGGSLQLQRHAVDGAASPWVSAVKLAAASGDLADAVHVHVTAWSSLVHAQTGCKPSQLAPAAGTCSLLLLVAMHLGWLGPDLRHVC